MTTSTKRSSPVPAVGLVFVVSAFLATPTVGEGSEGRWWIQQESVEPTRLAEYEKVSAEFFESVSSSLTFEIFALRGEGPVYTYLMTAPEAAILPVRRLQRERIRNLTQRGLVAPDTWREWTVLEFPELSRPSVSQPPDEGYFSFIFHYVAPGKESSALRTAGRLADLRSEKGIRSKAFRVERDDGLLIYVVGESGWDRAVFHSRQRLMKRLLGEEGTGLAQALEADLLRVEVIEGEVRPQLTYPERNVLARAMWRNPPVAAGDSIAASAETAKEMARVESAAPEAAREPPSARAPDPPSRSPGALELDFTILPPETEDDTAARGSLPASAAKVVPLEPLAVPVGAAAERVLAWAAAWSEQRVDAYLSFYATGFRPPQGESRRLWEAGRRQRLMKPKSIEVTLESLDVRGLGPLTVRAEFLQTYRSDSYRDVVRKLLVLTREGGEWRIVEERVIAALG